MNFHVGPDFQKKMINFRFGPDLRMNMDGKKHEMEKKNRTRPAGNLQV